MKRMVKNGDLIDVEPDGSITVAGKPIGGGGGSNDREITLTMPFSSTEDSFNKKLYLDTDTWNKINNKFYETINIYYNDGNPLGVFNIIKFRRAEFSINQYATIAHASAGSSVTTWYGKNSQAYISAVISVRSDANGNYLEVKNLPYISLPNLDKEKFDALYKLADKPTQDGTYVLKATVSGGAVTYTWVAQ